MNVPVLEGEQFNSSLFAASSELLQAYFAERPAVLVFEDIHWSDSSSVEMLLKWLPLLEKLPLVLLCAFRPDRNTPSWKIRNTADEEHHHRFIEIVLAPLSEAESDEMINRLLAIAELSVDLRARIMERSGGNPFYVEEVVRTLVENGNVVPEERSSNGHVQRYWHSDGEVDDLTIPDSLQSLLAARIDRLEEETRNTLQLAAVIGRSFYARVLQSVGEQVAPSGELESNLSTLIRMEMIQEAARLPEVEYRFRNPLTQEVAYETILLKRRREFHLRVGESMEALFAEQLDDLGPRFAYHFQQAGESLRALEYFVRAGDSAYRLYANNEAVANYENALMIVRAREDVDLKQVEHVYTRIGRAHELLSEFKEALEIYKGMEALARERDLQTLVLSSLLLQGSLRSTFNDVSDVEVAESLAKQALELAEALGDEAAEAKINWNLLNMYRAANNPELGLEYGERAMELSRRFGLKEQLAFVANDLPYVYFSSGEYNKGFETLAEARELWRELGNKTMLADSLSTSCSFYIFFGDLDRAIASSEEAYEISTSIQNLWGIAYSQFVVGIAHWQKGDVDLAIKTMQITIKYGEQAGFVIARSWGEPNLGLIYAELGQLERGFELLESTKKYVEENFPDYVEYIRVIEAQFHLLSNDPVKAAASLELLDLENLRTVSVFIRPNLMATQASLALAEGNPSGAAEIVNDTLGWLTDTALNLYVPTALHLLGKADLALGRHESSMDRLSSAREKAFAMGARWQLWQIDASIAEVALIRGDLTQAESARAAARESLAYIIEHSPPDLGESFQARPDVKALLER